MLRSLPILVGIVSLVYSPAITQAQQSAGNPNQQAYNSGQANGMQGGLTGTQIPVMQPGEAVRQGVAQVKQQPFPDLSAEEQKYLDQVLAVWEQRTAQIERFECKFNRWQYDPTAHPTAPSTIAGGLIKFASPDKGLFDVQQVQSVADKNPQPKYQVNPRRPNGEYWICDGEWVHIMDRNDKKAQRIQLPPAMRGKSIHLSPLPFLFGVKANEIKQRYWIRPIAAPEGNTDLWLEAFPKRPDDSGNYSRIQVALDMNDALPKTLIVFLPNWRPEARHIEHYEFSDRKINSVLDAFKQRVFFQEFISTKLPADWEVVEEPWLPPQNNSPQDVANQGQGSPNLLPNQRTAQPNNNSAPRNR